MEDKENRKGEKKESKRSRKKLGMNQEKNQVQICLMCIHKSKILYNLQQKLAQNLAKL